MGAHDQQRQELTGFLEERRVQGRLVYGLHVAPAALMTCLIFNRHGGHVHFVDSNRRPAGCGHLDYGPVVKALTDTGYDGYASAEALPYPDPDAAARQTIAAFRRWFRG